MSGFYRPVQAVDMGVNPDTTRPRSGERGLVSEWQRFWPASYSPEGTVFLAGAAAWVSAFFISFASQVLI